MSDYIIPFILGILVTTSVSVAVLEDFKHDAVKTGHIEIEGNIYKVTLAEIK